MEDTKRIKLLKKGKRGSVGSFHNVLIKPYLEGKHTETENVGSCCI